MRILVIILSSFAGLVLVFHSGLILHLNELIKSGAGATEAVVWVGFFSAWVLATALVAPVPSLGVWLFAGAGVLGLFIGTSTQDRLLIVWGAVAMGLAVLTTLAQREKRAADQVEWYHEQRDIAVHLALRSLQETAPELLARIPEAGLDAPAPVPPASPHPGGPAPAATAHSYDALPPGSSPAGRAGGSDVAPFKSASARRSVGPSPTEIATV